ncbi:MAG TPA: zinc ribbon domain-containing protein [Candidatus Binatia bacterium]|nr:zinc ribbon domain-containing protein [Candidatus Binatia bacterium]
MCGCGCGCASSSDEERREAPGQVAMVPCKYCGALFQQTATFCPNCGAKRTV